ncbi:hypothetical protein OK016_20160 [Vibrio chagasii]|nr:hypothetical protein [Vibrio chagasii]
MSVILSKAISKDIELDVNIDSPGPQHSCFSMNTVSDSGADEFIGRMLLSLPPTVPLLRTSLIRQCRWAEANSSAVFSIRASVLNQRSSGIHLEPFYPRGWQYHASVWWYRV